jgi:hypothetical protein
VIAPVTQWFCIYLILYTLKHGSYEGTTFARSINAHE